MAIHTEVMNTNDILVSFPDPLLAAILFCREKWRPEVDLGTRLMIYKKIDGGHGVPAINSKL